MNPINRFLYLNMNYHVEHHMFPLVPYHNLPKLHALVLADAARAVDVPPRVLVFVDADKELARAQQGAPSAG